MIIYRQNHHTKRCQGHCCLAAFIGLGSAKFRFVEVDVVALPTAVKAHTPVAFVRKVKVVLFKASIAKVNDNDGIVKPSAFISTEVGEYVVRVVAVNNAGGLSKKPGGVAVAVESQIDKVLVS